MKAPNEKLIETLFIHHTLRHLESYGGFVYTPSSREEYQNGYDAKLMGARAFDELYLQFKMPNLLNTSNLLNDPGYSFATYKHQHDRLQSYPIDTAYYLTPLFRSLEQIQQALRQATGPLNFLEWYVAIEIGRLGDVKRFRYYGDTASRRVSEVLYRLRTDWELHPKHYLDESDWMTGAELLLRFENHAVGARMILEGGEGQGEMDTARLMTKWDRERVCQMSPERAREMVRGNEKTDWGFALRKNADTLLQNSE